MDDRLRQIELEIRMIKRSISGMEDNSLSKSRRDLYRMSGVDSTLGAHNWRLLEVESFAEVSFGYGPDEEKPDLTAVTDPKYRIYYATDTDKIYYSIDNEWVAISDKILQYVHNQAVASDTWVIEHDLGRFPAVTVVDSSGRICVGNVKFDSEDQITVEFSHEFSGKAYLV